jgi:hypothetical protein
MTFAAAQAATRHCVGPHPPIIQTKMAEKSTALRARKSGWRLYFQVQDGLQTSHLREKELPADS